LNSFDSYSRQSGEVRAFPPFRLWSALRGGGGSRDRSDHAIVAGFCLRVAKQQLVVWDELLQLGLRFSRKPAKAA